MVYVLRTQRSDYYRKQCLYVNDSPKLIKPASKMYTNSIRISLLLTEFTKPVPKWGPPCPVHKAQRRDTAV